jgi:molecular chaperone GrpE
MERLSAKVQGLETAADQSHAQVSDLQAEVDAWKTRVAQLRNREADVRRQALHQAELSIHEERQRLLEHMLGVADNLERALAHADEHDPLYAGVRLSLDDLLGKLAKEGVEPLKAVGKTFDPNVHEAVAVDGSGGSRVVKVLETGYTLNGELLRPARVIVGGAAA